MKMSWSLVNRFLLVLWLGFGTQASQASKQVWQSKILDQHTLVLTAGDDQLNFF